MRCNIRPFWLAVLAALCLLASLSSSSHAAPNPKITDYEVFKGQLLVTITDDMGKKQVVAEKSGMTNFFGEPQALIVGGGYGLIYQAPGSAPGGFEGETQAVKHFNVNGVKTILLNEPLRVNRIREVRSATGYPLYVVSMQDGGAGIPSLFLVDRQKGVIWQKFAARLSGNRNGKLVVALYPEGEEAGYENTKAIGTTYLDLDRMVRQMLGLD